MDVVSRMFWEHSPVHASLSSISSLNAKTLISLSELCTRQRSIFSFEFTLRISTVSMSIKARNL
jgi:hypothetical protein